MKNLLSKKFSLAIASVVACATPFGFISLTSCGKDNGKIQFANFESYMDASLQNYLEDEYAAQFQWFTVTEMIETKFKDTYDVAIPCGYELAKLYKNGWLHKIDWSKFNIGTPESLFSEDALEAIDQMNTMLREYDGIPQDFDVLDYGVPYFSQSFCFMYKGEKLKFYSAIGSHEEVDTPNWADIFYTISPDCIYANRFGGKTGMLDDAKSLYDMSRIVQTIEANPDDSTKWTNQMPADSSIDDLKQTFKSLTTKAQSNWYRLSTDSGQIARILADHSDHGYAAALSWSGDALYAAQGAGEYDSYTGDQMHTVKPAGVSLDEIDFIVINNKNDKNQDKLDRIYKMIYDICFDAYNATDDLFEQVDDEYSIKDKRFKYWSMQNWDTVSYVPLLKTISDNVTDPDSDYWDDYAADDDYATRELMTSLITMPEVTSLFGRPLTALENSNTHWAWLETRGNL